jgi:purine-nucleoside phosphorylase
MDKSSAMERLRAHRAQLGIILGSGLGSIAAKGDAANAIPYNQFREIPPTSVPGHAGRFLPGEIGPSRVLFAQGRVHLYEGRDATEVTAIVRILAEAGIKELIITNAAGTLNPQFHPGEWMMIVDHINLTGASPLVGTPRCPESFRGSAQRADPAAHQTPRFLDLTEAYSPRLRSHFAEAAKETGVTLRQGVYAAVLGPQYETPAEVRMLQKLGADAVGMSTVLEVIEARRLGLDVAGFSCLTNFAAGISPDKLTHEEVLATGKEAAAALLRLLSATLPRLEKR